MAVTNSIPPQAYTRDVLVKAIDWIGTQPPAIREKATSADLLVSYYIQACRRSVNMEAPVSQENFKNDLKHLAEGLKQFEDPIAPPPQPPSRFPSYGNPDVHAGKVEPLFAPQPQEPAHTIPEPAYHPSAHGYVPHSQQFPPAPANYVPPPAAAYAPPPKAATKNQSPTWSIDPRSLAVARGLQQRLNLSNEGEALRCLISLGAERARELFP